MPSIYDGIFQTRVPLGQTPIDAIDGRRSGMERSGSDQIEEQPKAAAAEKKCSGARNQLLIGRVVLLRRHAG